MSQVSFLEGELEQPALTPLQEFLANWQSTLRETTRQPIASMARFTGHVIRGLGLEDLLQGPEGSLVLAALEGALQCLTYENWRDLRSASLKQRMYEAEEEHGFYLASGERTILSSGLHSTLLMLHEADWLFCKLFLNLIKEYDLPIQPHNAVVEEILWLSEADNLPSWLNLEYTGLYLKIFPAKRQKIFENGFLFEDSEIQRTKLWQLSREGSRGAATENGVLARNIIGHLGKVVQSIVYRNLRDGAVAELPKEISPYLNAINDFDQHLALREWVPTDPKAKGLLVNLFRERGLCGDAYRYTYDLVATWIIQEKYGRDMNGFAGADLETWFADALGLELKSIGSEFAFDEMRESVAEVDARDTDALLAAIKSWLKLRHPRLIMNIACSLMAVTRVLKCEFMETIGYMLDGMKPFTEVALPNGSSNLRCDIVLVPRDVAMTTFDWKQIPALAEVDVIELKLTQKLTPGASEDHTNQVNGYVNLIQKNTAAKDLWVQKYVVQIAGTGINLIDMNLPISDVEF
jgi:hypothetical protein